MADKDTLNLIKFKFGSFQSIKDLSSKDQSSFYFASDAPAFYNAGLWYGVSSLTSSVDEETGEVTLVINGGFGDNWKSSQVEHKFVAGMTKQQKTDLEKAVSFVDTVTSTEGEDTQTIIDKWNEIVAFLAGFKETDVLLERISTIETNVTNLQNTTITGGDGLTGGGNLLKNRTIALGTPSTITDKSINEATGTTHTHAIDEASTEQRGIVRLNDTLTSDKTDQALTANQGRVLKEHIDDMFELIDKGNGVKEIKAKYGLWSDSFISARGVDNESSGVGGLDAQAVWDLLMQNTDATKIINVAHIPDITVAKITDFTTKVNSMIPTNVSAFANDAGYINASHIANKADKDKTLIWLGDVDIDTAGRLSIGYNGSGTPFNGAFLNIGTDWGFQLIARHDGRIAYRGYKPSPDSLPSFEEWKRILDENGGELEGALTLQNSQFSGIKNSEGNIILGAGNSAAFIGAVDSNTTIVGTSVHSTVLRTTQDNLWHYRGDKGSNYLILDTANASSHVVDLTSSQTITGVKTFSNLRVNNSTMIANLNADKLDGLHASDFWNSKAGNLNVADIDVFTTRTSGTYTVRHEGSSSALFVFRDENYSWSSLSSLELYAPHYDISEGLKVRTSISNNRYSDWREVAFTDTNSLTPRSGTLTINGMLTVEGGQIKFKTPSMYIGANDAQIYFQTNFGTALVIENMAVRPSSENGTLGTVAKKWQRIYTKAITIGNASITWDDENQCLRVNSGIASDSFLSAKGIDTTGNGQGGGGGFDATMLWNELTIPSPTNSGKTIMLDLLPDMPTSKVTDFVNQVKALITVENIPILTSAKISDFDSAVATAMASTLADISSNLSNHEQRLQAIEQALTWQGI